MPTRAEWNDLLERLTPPPDSYVARNRAISACYARWYLQEPWLFKWAGMAAFASDQVGIAMALIELIAAPHKAMRPEESFAQAAGLSGMTAELYGRALNLVLALPVSMHDAATNNLLLQDLELIKQANDAIFADVGWAHVAYIYGGLEALEANLTGADQAELLEAFRLIDQGARLLATTDDYYAGSAMIDRGGRIMLRHEQLTILPPYMEQLSDLGRRIASIGSWLDFSNGSDPFSQPTFSLFFGPPAVLLGRRSIADLTDRWQWIEEDVLPKWARASAAYVEGCPMHQRLVTLANEQPNLIQQVAGLSDRLFPALGLQSAPAVR